MLGVDSVRENILNVFFPRRFPPSFCFGAHRLFIGADCLLAGRRSKITKRLLINGAAFWWGKGFNCGASTPLRVVPCDPQSDLPGALRPVYQRFKASIEKADLQPWVPSFGEFCQPKYPANMCRNVPAVPSAHTPDRAANPPPPGGKTLSRLLLSGVVHPVRWKECPNKGREASMTRIRNYYFFHPRNPVDVVHNVLF